MIETWNYRQFPDEFDAMIEHVEEGGHLALARNGEEVAVVLPYEDYMALVAAQHMSLNRSEG